VMNTYRAMGPTGYLLTNDSASPKILFQNFRRQPHHFDKRKPADPKTRRKIISRRA
jgi:hypothetical protein